MDFLTDNWQYITAAIVLAQFVTEFTPTPRDDKVVGKIYNIIEWVGLKLGKSKRSNRIKE